MYENSGDHRCPQTSYMTSLGEGTYEDKGAHKVTHGSGGQGAPERLSSDPPDINGDRAHSANASGGAPPVCEHCGAPATADAPVQIVAVDGEELPLHPACRAEWLGDQKPAAPPDDPSAIPPDNSVPEFLRRPMEPKPHPDSKPQTYLTDDDQGFIDDGGFK